MLQGRIAPPCSPAVGPGDSPKPPPKPMSRRNSFSRDMAATIAQQRTRPLEDAALDGIQLHVKDCLRPLSPRKAASFSLPKTPRKDDVDAEMNARVLRPTLSEYQLRRSMDGEETRGPASTRSSLAMFKDDVYLGDESVEVLTLDSAVMVDDEKGSSENSSPATSSYSPLSPTNDREHDDDAFESWLLEARVLESPVPAQKPTPHDWPSTKPTVPEEPRTTGPPAGDRTPPWLQAQRSPPIELSKSVRQIEHEIRHAIDSAASRVTSDLQRRDEFQQSIQSTVSSADATVANDLAGSSQTLVAATASSVAEEPELLLLMEVLIGDGRSESIEIHVGDRPEILANAFATKHGLAADAIPRLVQHIQDQLDALDEEEEEEQNRQVERSEEDQRYESSRHHAYEDEEAGGEDEDPYGDYRLGEYESSLMPPPAPVSACYDDREQYHAAQSAPQEEKLMREYEREHSYRHLMEKYGHYTSHSNKVNPTNGAKQGSLRQMNSSDAGRGAAGGSGRSPPDSYNDSEPLTMQNVEHARLMFTPRPVAFGSSTKPGGSKEKETVYNRLYSLAEAREKWIRRQQKAKAADEIRERQSQMKLEISAKSRDMIAGRGNGGYAHIGERLYDEALSDLAKKQRECEKRAVERQHEVDWTCPKCAFVNQHGDAVCKNIVASLAPPPLTLFSSSSSNGVTAAYEAAYNPSTTMALLDAHPEVVCGHPRPQQLFRPTLIAGASPHTSTTTQSVHATKMRGASVNSNSLNNQSQRRQRTQQQMEDEFRQTCPFKPKINDMSEEIMRDKLEQEAKASGGRQASVKTTPTGEVRRKNPHKALYEDAFHARAHREAKEQEYMAQFTFKPNIGVNALWSDHRGEDDVVERLAVVKYQELERKRASLHGKYAPDRDPTTGREYFKPEVGRAPIFNRNERGLPIGEFLYEAHKEHAEYHRRLRQQETDEAKRRSEQGFLSDKSKQALHQRKKKTFARLFDCLLKLQSGPEDGENANSEPRVVPSAVDVAQLPPEIARVVSVVFEFANDAPFTFTEFESFMDKLMTDVPGLTCTQILFLTESLADGKSARRSVDKAALQAEEEEEEAAELTFRPAIDKNSAAMAKKHGRAERAKVFDALNQYYDHYKDRADQARKQREREFARTHPFQPTFYTKNHKTNATSFYDKLHRSEMLAPTTATTSKSQQAESTAPSLRTAVPNARPFVRPIPTDEASRQDRSRANSVASSKHSDDEDAALTSRVLAALDYRPVSQPQCTPASTSSTVFSAMFSSPSSASVSLASESTTGSSSAPPVDTSDTPRVESMSLSELAM